MGKRTGTVPSVSTIYGLVIIIWPNHFYFFASGDFRGDRDAVIEQAKKNARDGDRDKVFIIRRQPETPESGFLFEPVEGNWRDLITDRTSVRITRDLLLMKRKSADLSGYRRKNHLYYLDFDHRPRDGETFAHFLAETAFFITPEERKEVPFHLFSPEILSLKDDAGCSVAVAMAANDVFPPEMINDETIDIDPLVPFYLLFYKREGTLNDIGRTLDQKILTKKRLVNPDAPGIGADLAVTAAWGNRIPKMCKYDPEILSIKAASGWTVLKILMDGDPGYIRGFPVESITPELLETTVNLYVGNGILENISFRDALAREGKFPRDEAEAMNWLVSGPEDDDQVRAAELFYRAEYPPELYRDVIRRIRESYKKQTEGAATEPDFVERYIL